MYEKLVTFEEEKRKEHLYLLFNSIFICACLMIIFETVFKFSLLLFSGIKNEEVKWFFTTLLSPLCVSGAVFFPFFIYNMRQETPLKGKLKNSRGKASPFVYVCGIISVAAIVPILIHLGNLFCDFLVSRGYKINEAVTDMGSSLPANIFFVLYTSAVSAILVELALRGVVAEKLAYANTALAIILPALISAMNTYSLFKIPYLFVTGLIISFFFLKTKSLYLAVVMNFAANVVYDSVLLLRENSDLLTVSLISLLVAVVAFVVFANVKGFKIKYPEAKNSDEEYERLTKKEAFWGTFKSFAFWIFMFIFLFRLFLTYLDKPMPDPTNSDGPVQSETLIEE